MTASPPAHLYKENGGNTHTEVGRGYIEGIGEKRTERKKWNMIIRRRREQKLHNF